MPLYPPNVTKVTATSPLASSGGQQPDISVASPIPIADGGTGQAIANAAFNALAPSQGGNNGKVLQTDGTNTSWQTPSGGSPVMTTLLDNTAGGAANWTTSYTPTKSGLVRIDVGGGAIVNNTLASMNLLIGGSIVKTVSAFVNGGPQHMQFQPLFFSTTLAAGAHALAVTVTGAGVTSNADDHCSLMVTEY